MDQLKDRVNFEQLQQETQRVNKDRGLKYGNYRDLVQMQAEVKAALNRGMGYCKALPLERETINAIVEKLCRLANGDVADPDGWVDIAGYANLVVRDYSMNYAEAVNGAHGGPAQHAQPFPMPNHTGGAPRGR